MSHARYESIKPQRCVSYTTEVETPAVSKVVKENQISEDFSLTLENTSHFITAMEKT